MAALARDRPRPDQVDRRGAMLTSAVCRRAHFEEMWLDRWSRALGEPDPLGKPHGSHRKIWEYCAVAQALAERDMLRAGRLGLGFAVGAEPLPAAFAARGAVVLATDLRLADSGGIWTATGQHAASKEALWRPGLVGREAFERRVAFADADMRTLDGLLPIWDFIWSSCALEHLGTLEAGWDFVVSSARLLRPGGVAAHTTEFNVSSGLATIEAGPSVLYRPCDVERLAERLRPEGCRLEAPDFFPGDRPEDLQPDEPPYFQGRRKHIKLRFGDYVVTSMLLILHKAT